MRNRTVLTITLLVMLLGCPVLAFAQDDVTTLTVEDATGKPDATTEVNVSVSNGGGIGALDLALRYDPTVARFANAEAGPSADNALLETNEIEPGLLLAALADSDGLSGDGPLLVVTFNIAGSEGDQTTIAIEAARAYHYEMLTDIPLNTTPGQLSIVAEGVSPLLVLAIVFGILALGVLAAIVVLLYKRMHYAR